MLEQVSWIGIAAATFASMAIGAAWYSALAKPWMAASEFTPEQVAKVEANDQPVIYAVAAVCHVFMAFVLSGIIIHAGGEVITLGDGVLTAALAWLGFVFTTMTVNHRFQMRSWALTVIDSGHFLLVMLAQGAILGWFLG